MKRLSWHDESAPLGQVAKQITFADAADFIVKQFARFSPHMAEFAAEALERRWVEAEDRPGKRPGGFCTSFPLHKQTRIFMTFSGNMSNLFTLAHELGHAYHQHVMDDLERKQGLVSIERLNELMLAAQRTAYCDALAEYEPTFWASKLHFYITYVPLYNFPDTFGYLFSSGVYARALQEGSAFAERYVALLRDTGSMPVEQLAAVHLGVDLTQADFWEAAVRFVVADVDEFLRITENRQIG